MNKKVAAAITKQINKEYYSAYLYLAMNQYFEDETMAGMANWMYQQFREEQFHAVKMVKYLNSRGVKAELELIEKPKTSWENTLEVFKDTLVHEKDITNSINELTGLAIDEKDFATVNFLQWYINEQIEEEENVTNIIKQVELIGENGYGLLMLDKELGARTFVEPVAE